MSSTELAYLAGIIDGEGTITIMVNSGHFSPLITVSNTNEEVIYWIKDIIGYGSICSRLNRDRYKPSFYYRVCNAVQVKGILEKVIPYLIIKRELAKLVLEYCEDHKLYYRTTLRECDIAIAVRELNKRTGKTGE